MATRVERCSCGRIEAMQLYTKDKMMLKEIKKII